MSILLLIVITSYALEAGLYYVPKVQRIIAGVMVVGLPSVYGAIVAVRPSVLSVLLLITAIPRVVNLLRVVYGRLHADRLKAVGQRASGVFALVQLCLVVAINNGASVPAYVMLNVVVIAQIVSSLIVFWSARRAITKSVPPEIMSFLSDRELPTVTVAIPARNETQDMADCLDSILASDYPKLEVIVLDDCSHDKTPDIIKSFAHDGVLFVQGVEPTEHWLPKNVAYDRLSRKANGELILFCGVDARVGPQTIRRSVELMLQQHKDMISILPTRLDSAPQHGLVQPMRYWWELALPRRLFNRPPVLSTFWIIRRRTLAKLGGFAAVSRMVLPEVHFARQLVKDDGYSFWQGNSDLLVQTVKSLPEQRATAVRVRYPQIHQRLEVATGLVATELLLLAGPIVCVPIALLTGQYLAGIMSAVALGVFVYVHYRVLKVSDVGNALSAPLSYPIAILAEISLGTMSMFKYEFGTVDWKGRNVCMPVMRAYRSLPKF